VAGFAAARGYLPHGIPLLKAVAVGPGGLVWGKGGALSVDGRPVAAGRRLDRAGRALPRWKGCRVLRPDEVLLLGLADPASFDDRYFGPTPASLVVEGARLLWRA
jgi:type IV secretory pathway protease TraF